MADDDLFLDKEDRMEVDPNDLGPIFTRILTLQLAKTIAEEGEGHWKSEEELQEKMSSLLASCYGRGLSAIRIIVTRKNGRKVVRDLEVDKIAKTRRLS
jgi:hypothetical protein